MMWPYDSNWGGAWGAGGYCPMLWEGIVILLIIVGFLTIVLINRGVMSGNAGRKITSSSARQILDERYAKGEIEKQQYEEMKKEID